MPTWDFFMPKEKSLLDPEVVIPKIEVAKTSIIKKLASKKKLLAVVALFILGAVILKIPLNKKAVAEPVKTVKVSVDRSFDMIALSNAGKPLSSKVRLKVASAEKTNQVLVKDQTFIAKNHKLFLILNLELKNDATSPVNLIPGDLVRMTGGGDEENKFAPDLHNNLVLISAISTKNDRIGFVIAEETKTFKLYIGELEGKKETVDIAFAN